MRKTEALREALARVALGIKRGHYEYGTNRPPDDLDTLDARDIAAAIVSTLGITREMVERTRNGYGHDGFRDAADALSALLDLAVQEEYR